MPLGCETASTDTTTLNMAIQSDQSSLQTSESLQQLSNTSTSPSLDIDQELEESQCPFCNQESSNLDQNIIHMSKVHGLHINQTNLLVDRGTLLAYFRLVINECCECLYCGTQKYTPQAVQQHMMAKGHCKYDMENRGAEIKEFYDVSSSDEKEIQKNLLSMRLSDESRPSSEARVKRSRPSRRPDRDDSSIAASSLEQGQPEPMSNSPLNSGIDLRGAERTTHSDLELSTRAVKQQVTLNNQLSQLREGDRRSLAHLPTSQQRSLLATHHKQLGKARRTEQTQRSHLERAGNKVNCLDKTRLVRQPPHFGHVFDLNR